MGEKPSSLFKCHPMKLTTQVGEGTRPSMPIWILGNPTYPSCSPLLYIFHLANELQLVRSPHWSTILRWGRTRPVYALILASRGQPYIVLLNKLNMRCALDVASIVWSSQVSLLLNFKLKYLNESTYSKSLLLM